MPDPLVVVSLLSGAGAIGAATGAIITAWTTRQQVKALTLSLKAETMLKLLDKFDGDEFLDIRKTAAKVCLCHLDDRNPGAIVEPILDVLDDAAFLVKKGALDEEMMHHAFYHWARLYWQASETLITLRRAEEPAVWNNLAAIYPRLNEIERKMNQGTDVQQLTRQQLKDYMDDELS
jgi:hypothetical protein